MDEQLLKKVSQQMADILRQTITNGEMDWEQRVLFSKILEQAVLILQSEGQNVKSVADLPIRLRPLTPDDRRSMRRENVKRLRRLGYTIRAIAAELTISQNTILNDLK